MSALPLRRSGADYFAADRTPSPFQHNWSLGAEEQFYLIWPPMIIAAAWLIRRTRQRTGAAATSTTTPYLAVLALVAAVLFAVSLWATHTEPSIAFFAAHLGLAVGRRRPDCPDRHSMAATATPSRRGHRLGRTGRDPGGHEKACLEGMIETLTRARPKLILESWAHDREAVMELLHSRGYECSPFETGERRVLNYKCIPRPDWKG